MKDRIKQLMESLHMNQQSFASFVGIAPATLNGIFQERTRPTLNTVEAICKKMPNVNLMWLINGTGDMYVNLDAPDTEHQEMGDVGYGNVHGLPADHGVVPVDHAREPLLCGRVALDVRVPVGRCGRAYS